MTKILEGNEAEETFGYLTKRDPELMRQETADAVKRINQYIEEHKGNLLALGLFNALYRNYGRN